MRPSPQHCNFDQTLQLLMLGQNQLTSHYPDWGLAKIYRQVKISAKPSVLPTRSFIRRPCRYLMALVLANCHARVI